MTISIKDAGVFKLATPSIRVAGVWKPTLGGWIRETGIWKSITGKSPFVYSGGFTADTEGWSTTSGASWSSSAGRTNPGSLAVGASSFSSYSIPSNIAGGMAITATVWARNSGTTDAGKRLGYTINGGTLNQVIVSTFSNTYGQATISFNNPGENSVEIRFSNLVSNQNSRWDDWSISGTPL